MQVDSMDDELRNRLWNALYSCYWERVDGSLNENRNWKTRLVIRGMWHNYFRQPYDTIPKSWQDTYELIKEHFFSLKWNGVYDFIEFVANEYPDPDNERNRRFMHICNAILKRDLSGYRFIDRVITPITSEEEIAEIEEALQPADSLQPVTNHIKRALKLFGDKESPDYRNSIKESISAVEATCNLISGGNKATLADALEKMEKASKVKLHTALKDSFKKLYGYSSDAEGIRHALLDEPHLDFEDAKFMLVSCSAFINYLKVKSSKAGIML